MGIRFMGQSARYWMEFSDQECPASRIWKRPKNALFGSSDSAPAAGVYCDGSGTSVLQDFPVSRSLKRYNLGQTDRDRPHIWQSCLQLMVLTVVIRIDFRRRFRAFKS